MRDSDDPLMQPGDMVVMFLFYMSPQATFGFSAANTVKAEVLAKPPKMTIAYWHSKFTDITTFLSETGVWMSFYYGLQIHIRHLSMCECSSRTRSPFANDGTVDGRQKRP